ncbi:MAG: hypothetical protein IJT18_01340 [Oscillospiraceae bacterium]|nr:hypothetical protein [Oscillospiraceae bacterium]
MMKYGESVFDVVYLAYAVVLGVLILRKRRDEIGKLMGAATLILGCGDAFHLIPRVLNYFVGADFTAWLGVGKLVTSVTMTVFYLLLYRLWLRVYGEKENRTLRVTVWLLVALRVALCLLPGNRWLQNDSPMLWGIVRNVPFVALGVIDICLYCRKRGELRCFRSVWLLIALSFLFYIPVAVAAGLVPQLGMLMLPKTVCYMLLIWAFWRATEEI